MLGGHKSITTLVSVIIPCYNSENHVEMAVRSIMNQTYLDLEIIVINDCSTDRSGEILKKLRQEDPRIIYIENKHNLKLVQCLNLGLEIAKGHFIARMDADDISEPTRIQRQYQYLISNPSVGVLGTNGILFGEGIKTKPFTKSITHDEITKDLFIDSPFIHPSVMFRKSIVQGVGGYKDSYYRVEDYALWVELSQTTKFHNLPEKLIQYRVVKNSESRLSQENADIRHRSLKSIYRLLFEINELKLSEEQLDNYTYSMFRPNFSKLNPRILKDAFDLITYKQPRLFALLSIRWLAAILIKPKMKYLLLYISSKYTYKGARSLW